MEQAAPPRPNSTVTRPLRVLLVGAPEESASAIVARLQAAATRAFHVDAREPEDLPSAPTARWFDAALLFAADADVALELHDALRERSGGVPALAVVERLDAEDRARLDAAGLAESVRLEAALVPDAPLLERSLTWAVERDRLRRELERERQHGQHVAHHDPLTDLPNRQNLESDLRRLVAQARRANTQLAVLFLDLDRFKQINDSLGHAAGDRLLQEAATRIQGCIRESDLAARRGGDEFNVVLPDIRRGQDAARVARKIQQALSRPVRIDGQELYVGVSIGISLFPSDGGDCEALVKHADIAMYQAKEGGGGAYRFFQPSMTERALERLALEQSLRTAVEREEFVLHYQPQFDLRRGVVTGMEALVRWNHPDIGLIYPDEFIPVAEETGLIQPLGDWVLREACRQARQWSDQGLPDVSVAVNFSARQLHAKRMATRLGTVLAEVDLEPSRLEVEITESTVMEDSSTALAVITELREMGVGVAIDDFGTGHSSLAYLKRFPISKLKIDKSFVRTLLVDPKDAAITEAIVGMAHSLRLRACAEGVETQRQLEFLRGPGCDEIQGYVLSRPLPADDARELLAHGTAAFAGAEPASGPSLN